MAYGDGPQFGSCVYPHWPGPPNYYPHPYTTPTVITTTTAGVADPTCHICEAPYSGLHACSIEQLLDAADRADERAANLRQRAREEFDRRMEAGSPVDLDVNLSRHESAD